MRPREFRQALRGIRARLTLLFVAIFGATLIGFSALLHYVLVSNLSAEFDSALYNHTVDIAQSIDVGLFGDLRFQSHLLSEGEKLFPFSPGKALVQILAADGSPLARSNALGNRTLPFTAEDARDLARNLPHLKTLHLSQPASAGRYTDGQAPYRQAPYRQAPYRMISYRLEKPGIPTLILQVAVPLTMVELEKSRLLRFFVTSIPLVLLAAALGGLFLSARALRPVSAIAGKAREIGASRLSERLPVPETADEIRELALTLNGLLERLERSFRSQERFIADASHQLKTPLAVLRGELDLVMRAGEAPGPESGRTREFLQSASQEIDYLTRMIEDLLLLARVEAGEQSLAVESVRLDEIVLEVVSRLSPFARNRGVTLAPRFSEESSFECQGDPELLQCLFRNLIENAIKYSPEGGSVEVGLEGGSGELRATVSDRGPGIPEASLSRVFERFYRAEGTREKAPGLGLGLPIARRIAEAHGGALEASARPGGGTVFTVRIKII